MKSLFTALHSHPVLALPDCTKPFQIESDVSNTAIGGVLTQEYVAIHKSTAFFSNTLSSSEKNYSVNNYELLAIITCCKAWQRYNDRNQTIAIMDRKPLHLQT